MLKNPQEGQTLPLKEAVPAHLILAELDDVPWVGSWWSQILGFLQKLGDLAGDALHAEILRDNVHHARVDPSCGNWAAGVDTMYSSLGMQSPFLGPAGVGAVDPHTFRRNMADAYKRSWAGLHDSPRGRTAPSARAKSCTYLRWFARPGKMPAEPYFELPISLPKLRRLVQFRLGSHDLPIEQGRMARPIVLRYTVHFVLPACSWG